MTLQTIADRLGVSRTTVSNAYNRPDQLAPELRERVLATAEELGYTGPDPAARRLRSGGTEAVGLLFTESLAWAFTDPAAVMFLQGFATATEDAGLSMLILPGAMGRPGTPHAGRAGKDAVREAVVEGFCCYSLPEGSADLAAAIERRLPLVSGRPAARRRPRVRRDGRPRRGAHGRRAPAGARAPSHRRPVLPYRRRRLHRPADARARGRLHAIPSRARASPAGARRSRPQESTGTRCRSRSCSCATPAARRSASCWRATPASPRSSAPPIAWRSACSTRSRSSAGRTCRSSGSTTCPPQSSGTSRPSASRCWRRA